MHPVQHRPEFGWGIRRVRLRHRVRPEQALEVGRKECVLRRLNQAGDHVFLTHRKTPWHRVSLAQRLRRSRVADLSPLA